MLIQPGMTIQISMTLESGKTIYPRAMVYDIKEKKMIFSQTSPPLLRSHVGRYVLISSVLTREGKPPQRYGFLAQITDFIKDYEIASGARVISVAADIKSESTEVDLRESFRVKPFTDCGLILVLNKEEYPILDISLGGLLFSQPHSKISSPQGEIPLILVIDEVPVKVTARVMRVVEKEDHRFVACAFSGKDRELQSRLGRKILDIERHYLAKGRL